MNRKKNPKQTIENIIAVASKLFVEKGYSQTSMQDIVNDLGMSKGAIFHHFKSKEDIFNAVIEKQAEYMQETIRNWLLEMEGLTAKEKLQTILKRNIQDQEASSYNAVFASKVQNAQFIVANMETDIEASAPIFAELMREGIQDGSIATEFPDECAEVFFLLLNSWCDPSIFESSLSRLEQRIRFLQTMMKNMGVDIIEDQFVQEYLQYVQGLTKG